jgi:mono/diheme cytochrome c family protein
MKLTLALAAATCLCLTALPGAASGQQQRTDLGKREFESNCAACHGMQGRGDGPLAGIIDTRVADLSTLAKRNNGVFPLSQVYEQIDGSKMAKAHGTRDMPIWGQDYKLKAAEYYVDVPYDVEPYVRARILALAEYVYRLQVK